MLQDYEVLAEFSRHVRGYIRSIERANSHLDLEPRQGHLLVAVRGLPRNIRPRIAELAERLQIQHHSAVELIDRLERRGLVRRERGAQDRREVLVRLTPAGEDLARALVGAHLAALHSCGPGVLDSLRMILRGNRGRARAFGRHRERKLPARRSTR